MLAWSAMSTRSAEHDWDAHAYLAMIFLLAEEEVRNGKMSNK